MSTLWALARLLGRLHALRPLQRRVLIVGLICLSLAVGSVAAFLHGLLGDRDMGNAPDPTRLSELAQMGGASEQPWTFLEVAERSELAVEGVVVDVRPSRLSPETAEGGSMFDRDQQFEPALGELVDTLSFQGVDHVVVVDPEAGHEVQVGSGCFDVFLGEC